MAETTSDLLVVKEVVQFVLTTSATILECSDGMVRKIDETIEKTATIKRIEGEAGAQNMTTSNDLQFAIHQSQNYTATVADLKAFVTHEKRVKQIYKQIRRNPPNYKPLNDYISDIQQCLGKVTQSYSEFSESCNAALLTAEKGAIHCAEEQERQAARKLATQVVGGTATAATFAAGIGTGVALSVIAGVFTFGVGTVVGLSLTAAGTAVGGLVVGGAGAAATALIADNFKESEEAFRVLKENYKALLAMGKKVQLEIKCLQDSLQKINADVTHVIHNRDNHKTPRYALDLLQATLQRIDPKNPLGKKNSE